jgi:peptidoglycan/LPS O-acetylase OafA/YrhL
MATQGQAPSRLYALDALRGVAALSVVFWHWQHFWFRGGRIAPEFTREAQPLFDVFFFVYRNGSLAVDLFFTLSGFIFYWLYASAIADRGVSAKQFFVLRFSRLYPLHLCTLLAVAVGQAAYSSIHGSSFVYQFNDVRHFLLNLLMLPSVGLERGFSFNAPVWSVSIEVLLYALFFVLCRYSLSRPLHLAGLSLLGFALIVTNVFPPLARGLASFFLGGLTYWVYASLRLRADLPLWTATIATTTAALWGLVVSMSAGIGALRDFAPPGLFGPLFALAVLFPLTILSLALLETRYGPIARRLSFLGDISYSSYLWHFPLQLALVVAVPHFADPAVFFTSVQALVLYFVLLVALSLASYHYMEMPAQRLIRRGHIRPKKPN